MSKNTYLLAFIIKYNKYANKQKFMQFRKDKTSTKLIKDFETWKSKAKEILNSMEKGKLTENEVYE